MNMSDDNFKILENDANNIEDKLTQLFDYFENEIINLVDQINILKKEIDNRDATIASLNSKLQNISNIMNGAIKRDIVKNLKPEVANLSNQNTAHDESKDFVEPQHVPQTTQENFDSNTDVDEYQPAAEEYYNTENTSYEVEQNNNNVENVDINRIENSTTEDILDVDEDEDPFSSASDDDWDKDINTESPIVDNVNNGDDDFPKEDIYEDEYTLNEDDTDSFLFDDEK